ARQRRGLVMLEQELTRKHQLVAAVRGGDVASANCDERQREVLEIGVEFSEGNAALRGHLSGEGAVETTDADVVVDEAADVTRHVELEVARTPVDAPADVPGVQGESFRRNEWPNRFRFVNLGVKGEIGRVLRLRA